MTLFISILAVAFAALCVWLIVRVANRRERWAKWTLAVLLVSLLAYPLSAGPATMIFEKLDRPFIVRRTIDIAYRPLVATLERGPKWDREIFSAYIDWWVPL